MTNGTDRHRRAALHAALGEPARLAIVDELTASDRSPAELGGLVGLGSNLLAHHLDVLEGVGLVERSASSGDRRRRYVRLQHEVLGSLVDRRTCGARPARFVCTANSARSQLAAALWRSRTGEVADSAGTRPATEVHPGAVASAARAGLDLSGATPRAWDPHAPVPPLVVTVCDRAHEELAAPPSWWHWSLPDPVAIDTDDAFDQTVRELERRLQHLVGPAGNTPDDSSHPSRSTTT